MNEVRTQGRGMTIAGWVLTTLPALFLLADAVGKLVKPEPVVKATTDLGYSESVIIPLGVVLLVCTVLYLVPKTSIIGAILLTGYLGGAVATDVASRVSNGSGAPSPGSSTPLEPVGSSTIRPVAGSIV